jgi:hypothetical protein
VPAAPFGDFRGFPVESPGYCQGFSNECTAYSAIKSACANALLDGPVPEVI